MALVRASCCVIDLSFSVSSRDRRGTAEGSLPFPPLPETFVSVKATRLPSPRSLYILLPDCVSCSKAHAESAAHRRIVTILPLPSFLPPVLIYRLIIQFFVGCSFIPGHIWKTSSENPPWPGPRESCEVRAGTRKYARRFYSKDVRAGQQPPHSFLPPVPKALRSVPRGTVTPPPSRPDEVSQRLHEARLFLLLATSPHPSHTAR